MADPELQNSEVIGWGCSHRRCDVALLDREIHFRRRYFGQKNQVVMIVKPENMQAVLAGIFLPGTNGVIEPDRPTVQLRSAILESVHGSRAKMKDARLAHHTHVLEGGSESPKPDMEPNRIPDSERAPIPTNSSCHKLLAIADEPAAALTEIEKADEPRGRHSLPRGHSPLRQVLFCWRLLSLLHLLSAGAHQRLLPCLKLFPSAFVRKQLIWSSPGKET